MSRFFFALCPDKSTTEEIIRCRDLINLSGRIITRSNLHLTLLFLGPLTINQLQKIIRQSEQLTCTEFDITLNHIGYFKKSRVTWLGLENIPHALLELHQQLVRTVNNCDIALQAQEYKPHVSLARKSSLLEKQSILPVKWHVKKFLLLESIDTAEGVRYQPVKIFSCAG